MVALNVRTTPADELDTDLFGAVESVFAGTTTARKGAFELAENGTVYLQEIDALSLVQQGKLLRVLEESKVRRRGTTRSYSVSARFVASCHQDLSVLVEAGKFREDLYTFLSRHILVVPALRERKEDIMPLARIFLRMYAERHTRAAQKFAEGVSDFLVTQPWPGNVRELQTRVESAVLHSQGTEVLLSDFCPGGLDVSTDPIQS
jgi:DNA-binding NtrC family response regulator